MTGSVGSDSKRAVMNEVARVIEHHQDHHDAAQKIDRVNPLFYRVSDSLVATSQNIRNFVVLSRVTARPVRSTILALHLRSRPRL